MNSPEGTAETRGNGFSRPCGTSRIAVTYPRTNVLGYVQVAPPPGFLWNLVALANFMRLSLLKGARADSSSVAWQEIRVRGWICKSELSLRL
jgi:hypothetical protein